MSLPSDISGKPATEVRIGCTHTHMETHRKAG